MSIGLTLVPPTFNARLGKRRISRHPRARKSTAPGGARGLQIPKNPHVFSSIAGKPRRLTRSNINDLRLGVENHSAAYDTLVIPWNGRVACGPVALFGERRNCQPNGSSQSSK